MAIYNTFTDSATGASITPIKLSVPSLFILSSPPHPITSSMAFVLNDVAADASTTARPQEKLLLDFIVHMMLIACGNAVARLSTDDAWEIPFDDVSSSASEEQAVPTPTLDELAVQMINRLQLSAHGSPAALNNPERVMHTIT